MLKAFFSSATGMRAQELLIDNTANNLANVNSNGFKKKNIHFADLIYDTIQPPGAADGDNQSNPTGLQIGSGVRAVGTTSVFSQGTPTETGIDTNVAIEGEGFFKVTSGGRETYTRDGSFTLNSLGQMVNGDGFLLDPQIQFPQQATDISISPQGIVSYFLDGVQTQAGAIQLYRFANPAGLLNLGGNLYQATESSGQEIPGAPGEDGLGSLRQSFVEGSNVEVVSELVSLITAQRAYEINSRAIRAGDEMLSIAGELVR